MTTEFCEHLAPYGVLFIRAEASYQNLVNLLDTYLQQMDHAEDAALAETLLQSLRDWVAETGMLRREFEDLVDSGDIELVKNPEARRSFQHGRFPMCGECSFKVPRLEFSEFHFEKDGRMKFRGQALPKPEKREAGSIPAPQPAL